MNILTCNGYQFKNIKVIDDVNLTNYIGFKYLRYSDLLKDNNFILVYESTRLLGVLKYTLEERVSSGVLGLLGKKFLYIRIYYIDIRSDKNGDLRKSIRNLLLNEFCDYICSLNMSKNIVNISKLKGYDFDDSITDILYKGISKVKIIKRGRIKYGK